MELPKILAQIKIQPKGSTLDITVRMPYWVKVDKNNVSYIDIPMLGIETFSVDSNQVDTAVDEAIKLFFMAAEEFGDGINKELTTLGWQNKKGALRFKAKASRLPMKSASLFNPPEHDSPIFQHMMKTGVDKSLSLSLTI